VLAQPLVGTALAEDLVEEAETLLEADALMLDLAADAFEDDLEIADEVDEA